MAKEKDERICPFMSQLMMLPMQAPISVAGQPGKLGIGLQSVPCRLTECELWACVPTTEGNFVSGCAFKVGALLNADGKIQV